MLQKDLSSLRVQHHGSRVTAITHCRQLSFNRDWTCSVSCSTPSGTLTISTNSIFISTFQALCPLCPILNMIKAFAESQFVWGIVHPVCVLFAVRLVKYGASNYSPVPMGKYNPIYGSARGILYTLNWRRVGQAKWWDSCGWSRLNPICVIDHYFTQRVHLCRDRLNPEAALHCHFCGSHQASTSFRGPMLAAALSTPSWKHTSVQFAWKLCPAQKNPSNWKIFQQWFNMRPAGLRQPEWN